MLRDQTVISISSEFIENESDVNVSKNDYAEEAGNFNGLRI